MSENEGTACQLAAAKKTELTCGQREAIREYVHKVATPVGALLTLLGFILGYAVKSYAEAQAMKEFATNMASIATDVGKALGKAEQASMDAQAAKNEAESIADGIQKSSELTETALKKAAEASRKAQKAQTDAQESAKSAKDLEDDLTRVSKETADKVIENPAFLDSLATNLTNQLDARLKAAEENISKIDSNSLKNDSVIALLTAPDGNDGAMNVPVSYIKDPRTDKNGVRFLVMAHKNFDPKGDWDTTVGDQQKFLLKRVDDNR